MKSKLKRTLQKENSKKEIQQTLDKIKKIVKRKKYLEKSKKEGLFIKYHENLMKNEELNNRKRIRIYIWNIPYIWIWII